MTDQVTQQLTVPALVLRADGTHDAVQLADGDLLPGLYAAIGNGCTTVDVIDFPDLPGVATLWLDDEGMYHEPVRNQLAGKLYAEYTGARLSDVHIVGNVVLTGGTDENGDTLGLAPESRDFILSQLGLSAV